MNTFLRSIIIITFCSALLWVAAAKVGASAGVTLSPATYSGNHLAGEQVGISATLTNNTDANLTVSFSAAEFQNSTLTTEPEQTAGWLALPPGFTLPGNRSIDFSFSVIIPDTATDGAYQPVLLINCLGSPDASQPGSGAAVQTQIAFPVNLNVGQNTPMASLHISHLQVENPVLDGTLSVNYTIHNITNFQIKPIAYLQLVDVATEQVLTKLVINENLTPVGADQHLSGMQEFNLTDLGFSSGRLRVELLAIDQQFQSSDILKQETWVLPPILTLVAMLAAVLLILFLAYKAYSRMRPHPNKTLPFNR